MADTEIRKRLELGAKEKIDGPFSNVIHGHPALDEMREKHPEAYIDMLKYRANGFEHEARKVAEEHGIEFRGWYRRYDAAEIDDFGDWFQDGDKPESETVSAADRMMSGLLDADGLEDIPDPEWLIKGWLTRDTLARINGEPNTGKSLVALDWAGCVGTGTLWHGCATEKGTVLYVIAEGVRGFKKRKRAWVKHHAKAMSGVLFYPEPIQVKKPDSPKAVDQWATLAEVCAKIKPVLIVLDTQSRVTVGVEENSNTEMGVIVARLEAMRRLTGACVLLAHHTPKGGEGGRGAGAMSGAINTEFQMVKKGRGLSSIMTLENTKEKDEEDGRKILLRFKVYNVGDEDPYDLDEPMTSVVLVHEEDDSAEDVIPVITDSDDNRSKFRSIIEQVWPVGRFTQAQACGLAQDHGGMKKPTAYRIWGHLVETEFIEPVPHATTGNPTEKYRIKRGAVG
ncbi:AAA family ATPase [Streptomyces sp. NBC_00588]|uniref:AAA family ATPase n=1 Tax=Streptomyces sp. NBC_00588 TaxID=2975784 RepID=UPI002E81DA5F|nr:AAA family ATPase [Streptomyces sp. NBC_00588]WUB35521.1 helicase RepA family protein [Streptomyces sp. NBC_00588]